MNLKRTLLTSLLILSVAGCGGQSPTATPPTETPTPETPTEAPNPSTTPVTLQAVPNTLAFPGTSEASFAVTATGAWEIQADQPWLSVTPASGTGNATVTVKVDRSGVTPGHYAGSLLLKGDAEKEVVSVYMRFPQLSGNLFSPAGQLQATSLHTQSIDYDTVVPDEVLVKLEPAVLATQAKLNIQALSTQSYQDGVASVADDYGLEVLEGLSPVLPVFKLGTKGQDLEDVLDTLRRDGRVAYAEPNRKMEMASTPNDPRYTDQWHYDNINLPKAWGLTEGSSEIVVAVLDSGVDTTHPDLRDQLVPGYDFGRNTTQVIDESGHGTHVAGTIAARSNNAVGVAGVAQKSKIMPVRVFGSNDEFSFYRGLLFAAGSCVPNTDGDVVCPEQSAQVVNMSVSQYNRADCGGPVPTRFAQETLAFVVGSGVSVIASAGNDDCSFVSFPASDPSVIAVTATGPDDTITWYSNYGEAAWIAAPGGDIDTYGQGGGVLSTAAGGGYEYKQGTSMAAPHVSGVAALILAANPDLTPTDVRIILQMTAADLGGEGWDPLYGYGLVDAEAAVAMARASLNARNSDFTVRLSRAGRVVREVRADAGGNFTLEDLPEGSYTLEAGNDRNGNGALGDPGEFYGVTSTLLSYSGDRASVGLNVQAQ